MLTIQVGHMIQAESDNTKRDEYLKRLMSLPNQVSCFVFQHALWFQLWLVLEYDFNLGTLRFYDFTEVGRNNWTGKPKH